MRVKIKVNNNCDLCGLCVECCPMSVFELKGGKLIVHEDNCIYCRGCEVICHVSAIRVTPTEEDLTIEVVTTLGNL